MKEDYLWDKTGTDAGIEKLENSLKTFRSQKITPPALPAKTFGFDKGSGRSFRLAFAAFAAFAGLFFIAIGVFQISQIKQPDLARNTSEELLSEPTKKPVLINEETSAEEATEKEEPVKPLILKAKYTTEPKAIRRQSVRPRKQVPAKFRTDRTIAKNIKPIKAEPQTEPVKLTEEEQYAYDQLMTALAITSSKLKLVKDKVQGIE
jgi:hypothetical protein